MNSRNLIPLITLISGLLLLSTSAQSNNLFKPKFGKKDDMCNYQESFFMKDYKGDAVTKLKDSFSKVEPNALYTDYDRSPINEDLVEKEILKSVFSEGNTATSYSVNREFLEKVAPDAKTLRNGLMEKILNLPRVDGYFFHGSRWTPEKMKSVGGICNKDPSMDIIQYWVAQPGLPHPGWVSFSRSIPIAKKHASTTWLAGHLPAPDGWVYVFYVEGGFLLPTYEQARPQINIADFYARTVISNVWFEQEVTVYRSASWSQVVAYRAIDEWGYMFGDIHLRDGLKDADPDGYRDILDALSGKEFVKPK